MSILISIYYVGSFIRENTVIVSRAINCEIPCTHVTRFVHAYVAQHPLLRRGVSLCMPNRANLSGFDGRYQRYVTRWLRDRRCKPNTSPLSRFGYSLSLFHDVGGYRWSRHKCQESDISQPLHAMHECYLSHDIDIYSITLLVQGR